MSDFFPAFKAELWQLVKDTWGLDDAHIFTSLQAIRDNIVEHFKDGKDGDPIRVDGPIAVICLGSMTSDDEWGLDNYAKRAPVTIWFIDNLKDRDNQSFVHGKAFELAQAIDNASASFATFQSIETATINSSESAAVNDRELESAHPLIAACADWSPGLLVGTFNTSE